MIPASTTAQWCGDKRQDEGKLLHGESKCTQIYASSPEREILLRLKYRMRRSARNLFRNVAGMGVTDTTKDAEMNNRKIKLIVSITLV